MKKALFLAVLGLIIATATAQNFNTRLIPTPQKVVKTEGVYKVPADLHSIPADTVEAIVGAMNQREAYRLVITPKGAKLYFAHPEGAVEGRKTFWKLKELWNSEIPCMEITDWPAYDWRGFLDDISRGPIPTEAFRNRQYRELYCNFNLNFANYYTEHALYNPQYPDIVPTDYNGGWSYNQAWIKMANLQCFAHFEKTLRIPFYQNIMDTRYNVDPSNEATYDFLRSQIENTLKSYYHWTPFFNINCDETESLGSGHASQYVNSVGADEAYCRHINRVYDLIQECAKRRNDTLKGAKPEVLMWGDIVGKNPKMLKELPRDMNYIVWSYVAQESYAGMIEPFRELHFEQGTQFWVAPGVSHWSSIPQVHNYIQNIAYLARDGYLAGARGLMNTAWDDSGESLFGDCWHAMAWGAEMAWNPIKNTDPEKARQELAERERLFNENYNRWMELQTGRKEAAFTTEMIYHVGDLAGNKWIGDWFNTGALMQPLMEFYPANVGDAMLQRCDSADRIVHAVLNHLDSTTIPHFAYACHRILCVSEKSRLRAMMYAVLQGNGDATEVKKSMQQYFEHLHQLKLEYLRLWDEECTTYSREIICDRYDRLGYEVLEADRKVFVSTQEQHGTVLVTLRTLFNDRPIYYTLDGRQPTQGATLYNGAFPIRQSCTIKAVSYNQWDEPAYSEQYLLCHKGMGHFKRLNSQYSTFRPTYSGGGDEALCDGVLGSDNSYADGHWQGYWGNDIDIELDLHQKTEVNSISMRFLQNTFDWILAPKAIEVYTSNDGVHWNLVRTESFAPEYRHSGNILHTDAVRNLNLKTRYLRVVVPNPGPLPEWHGSKGQPSYLFCDELVVE